MGNVGIFKKGLGEKNNFRERIINKQNLGQGLVKFVNCLVARILSGLNLGTQAFKHSYY